MSLLLIIFVILEILATGVTIFLLLGKYKGARSECLTIQNRLAKVQLEWQNEKRRLESEIDARKSELSSLSLHYIQKIELVNELKRNLDSFKPSIPKELAGKFGRLVDNAAGFEDVDKEWDNFRTYFNEVNFGFFDQLRAQYPNLSSKDLKLCALIRLNLETKQIATIMGVSPESAKVTRHRIRKKLGLSGDESIQDFLNGFSSMN